MKSKITETAGPKNLPFPKLMKYEGRSGNVFVLMHSEGKGTVVHTTDFYYTIGKYSDEWNKLVFIDFYGTLTLSND